MGHNFRELNIWKRSMDLVSEVYSLIENLPIDERYGLRSQIGRSAVSISSNLAEGSGRSDKEFIRFIDISLSSSYELETQLMIVEKVFGFEVGELLDKLTELQKMIGGFKRSLR